MRSRRLWGAGLVLLNLLLPALPVAAQQGSVQQDCLRYSERLGSVKAQSCDHPGWYRADALSRQGRPILLRDQDNGTPEPSRLEHQNVHASEANLGAGRTNVQFFQSSTWSLLPGAPANIYPYDASEGLDAAAQSVAWGPRGDGML